MSNLSFTDYIHNRKSNKNANVLSLFAEYIAWLVKEIEKEKVGQLFTAQQILFQLKCINAYLINKHQSIEHTPIKIASPKINIQGETLQLITQTSYIQHSRRALFIGLTLLIMSMVGGMLIAALPITTPMLFCSSMILITGAMSGIALLWRALPFHRADTIETRLKSDLTNFPNALIVSTAIVLIASACTLNYLPSVIAATSPLAPILLMASVGVVITSIMLSLSLGIVLSNRLLNVTAPKIETVCLEQLNLPNNDANTIALESAANLTAQIDPDFETNSNQLSEAVLATTKCWISSNMRRTLNEFPQSDEVDIQLLDQELKRVSPAC